MPPQAARLVADPELNDVPRHELAGRKLGLLMWETTGNQRRSPHEEGP